MCASFNIRKPDGASRNFQVLNSGGYTPKRSVYLEGRAYRGVDDDYYVGREYTTSELKMLADANELIGKPIFYEHQYKNGEIGEIVKSYLDDEGWICIGVLVYDQSPFHGAVIEKLKNGELDSFSIGYKLNKSDCSKEFLETSVTNDPAIEGCDILVCNSKKAGGQQNPLIKLQSQGQRFSQSKPGKVRNCYFYKLIVIFC